MNSVVALITSHPSKINYKNLASLLENNNTSIFLYGEGAYCCQYKDFLSLIANRQTTTYLCQTVAKRRSLAANNIIKVATLASLVELCEKTDQMVQI